MVKMFRPPVIDTAEIDKIEMAREILETGKQMELQGLKAILKKTIENPMIPSSAREHAEMAFQIASDLDSDMEWRENELRRWAASRKVKILEDRVTAVDPVTGRKVPVPKYIGMEPSNLKRKLDYEVAQIGMAAVETVYNDIVASKPPKRKPVGVMQAEEKEEDERPND